MPALTADQAFQIAARHHQAGRLGQAEQLYRQIVGFEPNHADALHFLGVLCAQTGRNGLAAELIRRAISLKPDSAEPYSNLGIALGEKEHLDEAIAAYRKAVSLRPNYPEALSNLGNALQTKGQIDDAIAAYRRAIALQPNYAKAYSNLGNALREMGKADESIAACRHAISLNPDFPDAHRNLAISLLKVGAFAEGWKEYEWRWRCDEFAAFSRNFPQPTWDGRPLAGATLLLHAEQGFGDTLQFIRYLPLTAQRGGRVIIECPIELTRLIKTTAPDCPVVARGDPLPAFDVHCPLLSLPRLFQTPLENIPLQVPYLCADPHLTEKWGHRLAGETGSLKMGLAWAGNPLHKNDRNRSLPLAAFTPLSQLPAISIHSLQKGTPANERANPPAGLRLADWSRDLADFADTAALIANLDLVISVDTAVAHLAGAMGKPVWLLLPFVADWRWMVARDDSPWYPTMRLFRQPAAGDWNSVIRTLAAALPAKMRGRH